MKKTVEFNHNIKSKISLILLIVMMFNIIIPNYSEAIFGISVIDNPIASLIMRWLDNANGTLAVLFASDAKLDEAHSGRRAVWDELTNLDRKLSRESYRGNSCW